MTDPTDADAIARHAAWIETGRRAFARPWVFKLGVPDMALLPTSTGAEAAFAGRSNVGKSSLINAIVAQTNLARTSNTPGRTQQLNLFVPEQVGSDPLPNLALVDMPGYGYAKAPKDEVKAWQDMVFDYLRGRPSLKRVYALIDARHGLKEIDKEVLGVLDRAAVSYQVVLTKADKIASGPHGAPVQKLVAATQDAIRKRAAAHPVVLVTSAEKGWGLETLRAELAALPGA